MRWYVYLAWKQLFPRDKKVSFFSAVSIFGVALGVAVLFVVQSVMEGFQYNIRQTIVDTQGDVRVDAQHTIYDGDNLVEFLQNFPGVEAAAKYAYGIGMLKYGNRSIFPLVKGVDIENELRVTKIGKFIKSGNLDNFDCGGIILSSELAESIGAIVGECVEIYSPSMLENINGDEVILPKTLEISAIYETGYHHADKNIAIVALDTLQDLCGLSEGIHGISLKLQPEVRPEKLAFQLNASLDESMHAASWQEMNRDLLFVLKMEKTMIFFILVFVLLISAFSIASSLVISVVRKTREIGLLSALGATKRQCAACFLVQGGVVGIAGSIIGIAAGAIILRFRNNIVALFVKLCGVDNFMLKFYSFANMPAKYEVGDIVAIVIFAIGICCIAGMAAAAQVAKINPAEALRNE
ncbi:MAG: ABC transporter permease [Puniceicoccales bacterium]|jgi:lipoprotein-releasing system permease protein|nr:ABC transporter permease [Puniceicoccales bacterium]